MQVQDIVGHKEVRGNLLYKIRWKGYGPNGDTWEPLETLSCPDLLVKYNKKVRITYFLCNINLNISPCQNKVSTGKRRGAPLKANRAKAAKYESSDEGLPSDDDEEYEVEKILNVNEKRNGKREFLVHWKGYSKGDAGWEPEENLSCQDLINSFMKTYEEKKNSQKTRVTKKATDRFSVKDNGRGRRSKRNSGKR